MNYFSVKESFGIRFYITYHCLNEILRLAATGPYEDPISCMDVAEYDSGGRNVLRICLLELFQDLFVFHCPSLLICVLCQFLSVHSCLDLLLLP